MAKIAAALLCQREITFLCVSFGLIRANLMGGNTVCRPHRVCATGCPLARLSYDAAGPCPDVARRTSRPSPERRRASSGRDSQAATTQKWLSVHRWEHPLHRLRRCAHRGRVGARTLRPGSPQHMRLRLPTYYDSLHDVWAWEPLAC